MISPHSTVRVCILVRQPAILRARIGLIVVGFIPFIIGLACGTDYFGTPVLGMITFCLFAIALGYLLDVLYEKTGCIWVPALGHGAINAATGVLYFLKPEYMDRLIFGPAFHGLIGMIPMVIVVVVLIIVEMKRKSLKEKNV